MEDHDHNLNSFSLEEEKEGDLFSDEALKDDFEIDNDVENLPI